MIIYFVPMIKTDVLGADIERSTSLDEVEEEYSVVVAESKLAKSRSVFIIVRYTI